VAPHCAAVHHREFGLQPKHARAAPVRCDIQPLAASVLPVLAVIPRDETLHDGPTMAERFRQQLPRAQAVLVDDANHLVLIDRPDVVSKQLRNFLGATSSLDAPRLDGGDCVSRLRAGSVWFVSPSISFPWQWWRPTGCFLAASAPVRLACACRSC
jgi:hypothetical protein